MSNKLHPVRLVTYLCGNNMFTFFKIEDIVVPVKYVVFLKLRYLISLEQVISHLYDRIVEVKVTS